MDAAELRERLREFEGVETGPPQTGPDPVNAPMIRHWCEAMGDRNPVYLDPAFAEKSVHGGLVAPPTMLQAWAMPGIAAEERGAGGPRNRLAELLDLLSEAGYPGIVATNCVQEYPRYLRPGERIESQEVIQSISDEKTTALGPGRFVDTVITFRSAGGEVVGRQEWRLLKFRPAQAAAAGAPALQKPRHPRPVINIDNAFFWEGVGRGELLLQRCAGCGALRHPPRPMCPHCQSLEWRAEPASGRGTVYSFAVVHNPQFPPFEYPLVAAIIALEEGPRLVSNVVDVAPDAVSIGEPVRVVFREVEEGLTLPLFRPEGS